MQVTALDLGPVGGPVDCEPVTWNHASADDVVQVACFLTAIGLDTPTEDGLKTASR
jgi:hypothetical protein